MADPSEYVEFYLGNMYAWTESGIARALTYLADCNVVSDDPSCKHYHALILRRLYLLR